MAKRIFFVFRNSMLGQMGLLTALFLIWGVYAFVVKPVLEIPRGYPRPVNRETASQVQDVFRQFLLAAKDPGGRLGRLATNPVIRSVQAANPGFRYYLQAGDSKFGNAGPYYFQKMGLGDIVRDQTRLKALNLCTVSSGPLHIDDDTAYADFSICPGLAYFEYRGLLRPTVANVEDLTPLYKRWFGWFSQSFLIAFAGPFLIFTVVLIGHTLMIRRFAKVAQSIDMENMDRKLPEAGLAIEVVPLVRAVNHLLGKIEETQQRQRFFLSAAAHEMRTPLTVLRTRMELVEDIPLKKKLVGDVRRLISMVEQLLQLMTIGNIKSVSGFVDLAACCQKAAVDARILASETGISIDLKVPEIPVEIPGDTPLIYSAIINLLRNAISFTEAGGRVIVTLDLEGVITVRDFGPGLPDSDADLLFEPFVRFPSNRAGHGLGLAIVRAISQRHGGHITAENAAGGGAIFTLTLPAKP